MGCEIGPERAYVRKGFSSVARRTFRSIVFITKRPHRPEIIFCAFLSFSGGCHTKLVGEQTVRGAMLPGKVSTMAPERGGEGEARQAPSHGNSNSGDHLPCPTSLGNQPCGTLYFQTLARKMVAVGSVSGETIFFGDAKARF